MSILEHLKPSKVFYYFEEIAKIPHGSGNTKQIAAWCMAYAKQHGLKATLDDAGNVIIYAKGTTGYENSEPVILQGHMDMVCEKTPDCTKDMGTEGLDLCTDDSFVWADSTTLGGDDGIALAYIFALLDSDEIPHPPIEAIITRDEETGMFGAMDFDGTMVSGKKIINIDSEEEGILTVSCAGGVTVLGEIPVQTEAASGFAYRVAVGGMTGGHSGADIHLGRQNGIQVLGELLQHIKSIVGCRISAPQGGGKTNVIPKGAEAVIVTPKDMRTQVQTIVASFSAWFAQLHAATDAQATFHVSPAALPDAVYTVQSTETFLRFLTEAKNGVIRMHPHIDGMVQTSLNLGVLTSAADKFSVQFLIRSNSMDEKDALQAEVEALIRSFDGTATHDAGYPAWEYREDSALRQLMVQVYTDQYGKAPQVSAIHAGLECGMLAEKIADADIISIGPNILDIHTPDERLDVASVARVWEYLKEILKRCK